MTGPRQHIPTTADVLRGPRAEGLEPFMVAQGVSRIDGKTGCTKHMIRLRHAAQVRSRPEACEIILINAHDGASSYPLPAGAFRYACCNDLVVGDVVDDIHIPLRGNVRDEVIEGPVRVVERFDDVDTSIDGMKALAMALVEELAFAAAALAPRYGPAYEGRPSAPITARRLTQPHRVRDMGASLWSSIQRVPENILRAGLTGRSANGRRTHTRPVGSIDSNVSLNRALWVLAEEMRRLNGLKDQE